VKFSMVGKGKSSRCEEAKWEFVRWVEGLIAVKSRVLHESPGASDRLASLMDVAGEASTPEEWAAAFVEKLARLVLDMKALQEVVDSARATCRREVLALEGKHAKEMSLCRAFLREAGERCDRMREEVAKAREAEREARRKLLKCEEEKNDLWDRLVGQSEVIVRQQERLERCGG